MAKVLVSVPNEGMVHKNLMVEFFRLIANHHGHDIGLNLRTGKPTDHNRNNHINDFLKSDNEVMLFWDADNPLVERGDGRNVLELVEKDLDVIAFPTPMRVPETEYRGGQLITWNIFEDDEHGENWRAWSGDRTQGLVEIDAAGSGCLMIARRVLEHPEMKPWFMREWNDDGTQKRGSDMLFCRKAQKLGFRIWCHWDFPCHHFKTIDMLDVWRTIHDRDPNNVPSVNPNTPEYWDEQWKVRKERILPIYDRVVEMLKENVGDTGRVLDYGCGRGDLARKIDEAGFKVEGMDISQVAADKMRDLGFHCRVGSAVIGRYDAIVATEVLEHIDDDIGKLREFFRHTDTVIFSVPNDCYPPGFDPEHRRLYTYNSVQRLPNVSHVEVHDRFIVCIAKRWGT